MRAPETFENSFRFCTNQIVGKNLRIVAQWWTLKGICWDCTLEYFNLQANYYSKIWFSFLKIIIQTRASRLYWAFLELSIFVQLSSQIRCYFNCFVKFLSWIWQISQIRCFLVSSKELWEVLHPVAGRDLSPLPAVTSICDLLAVKRTYPLNQPTATHITNQPTNQPYNNIRVQQYQSNNLFRNRDNGKQIINVISTKRP